MYGYILRRLALIVPTLVGIMLVNFIIVQLAPGGPIEQMVAQLHGFQGEAIARISGDQGETEANAQEVRESIQDDYQGARGLDPEMVAELEKQFGFDKPMHQRFIDMMGNYATFDFGESFFRGKSVTELIRDKLPVSVTLGLWTTLITYLVSIPLGIRKAVHDGTRFDIWTSGAIIVGYAIPGFLFAILLIVLFAGGSFWDLFPLRGLTSDNWEALTWPMKILDYLWHITLPVIAMAIGGFATLTLLTKNSFLDEINKQYVITAKAKGVSTRRVLYGHIFRNAMLIVIAGFPATFITILFTGSLLIEVIFSLDGLGLLGYEALLQRDYPVIFGTLYIFGLLGLVLRLVGDIMYVVIDPRIDFETREV